MFRVHNYLLFTLVILSGIVLTGFEIAIPFTLAGVIDNAMVGEACEKLFVQKSDKFCSSGFLSEEKIGWILIFALVLRYPLGLFYAFFHGKYVFATYSTLIRKFLSAIASRPIPKIYSMNVSSLVSAIDNESKLIANWFHAPFMTIINELLVLIIYIASFLILLDLSIHSAFMLMVIFILPSAGLIYLNLTNTRDRKSIDRLVIRSIDRFVSSLRSIYLANDRQPFINVVEKFVRRRQRSWIVQQGFSTVSRLTLETPVLLMIAIYIVLYNNSDNPVPTGSAVFVAFASLRLLPSLSKILSSISQISYCFQNYRKDQLAILIERGDGTFFASRKSTRPLYTLELRNFSVLRGERRLFRPIDHKFRVGQINLIVAPSGTGKSTFLDAIIGLSDSTIGEARFTCRSGESIDTTELRCSMVQQHSSLFFETVDDNIKWDTIRSDLDLSFLKNALKIDGLRAPVSGEAFEDLERSISGGESQRINIARSLLSGSDLILMDEPTSALDEDLSTAVCSLLDSICDDRLVIVVTHDPQLFIDKCRKTAIIALER